MSDQNQQDHISKKKVLHTMPGMDAVTVRKDVPYRTTDAGALTMDVYAPAESKAAVGTAGVIIVTGFSDVGAQKMFGSTFKEMASYVSWARLIAASGLMAVTYTNHEAGDVDAVLAYVRGHAAGLGIDENRIGLWSCSGHAPTALSLLMAGGNDLKCAALCYPYTMDLDGSTAVATAAGQFRFADACAGRSVEDVSSAIPLFIARAGQERMPGLNPALDRFVGKALARNLPLTIVNHPSGPHAFDLFHDSDTTREIIHQVLRFLRFHLADRA